MNFLKISGLVVGTGSVVGVTGAGIYYGAIKNSEAENTENNAEAKSETEEDQKAQFVGKLVFLKKAGSGTNTSYEAVLLNESEYSGKVTEFDSGKSDEEKHAKVNKVVDISHKLNVQKAKVILQEIFGNETTLENAKTKVKSEEAKLKELFGNTIYENLKTALNA